MGDEQGEGGGMMGMGGMIAQLGIVNKLSTGNMVLDVMMAMLIPLIMKQITKEWPRLQQFLMKYFLIQPDEWEDSYTCNISWTKERYYYYRDDGYCSQPPNYVLQEALDIYIGKQKDLIYGFEQSQANLLKSKQEKAEAEAVDEENEKNNGKDYDSEDYDSEDDESDYDNSAWLNELEINCSPPENVFVMLQPNLRFRHITQQEQLNQTTQTTKIYTLEARGEEPQKQVEMYLQKAYDYYKFLKQKKKGKKLRFYYRPLFGVSRGNDDDANRLCSKEYELSEEKTFNSWFHPEKTELLQLVDDFKSKQGKFSIAGYPNKLGLLLWGPPGTGKTTLIKALAQYTKRSIVEVPLTQIKTNQMLMDIMFDCNYSIEGESHSRYLAMNKIIFVFEDIDAAADVVKARKQTTVTRTSFNVPSQTLTVESFLKEDGDNLQNKTHSNNKGGGKGGGTKGLLASPFVGKETESTVDMITKTGPSPKFAGISYKDISLTSDSLNLAGLLNALDGVLDAPGRIVVMTTNHPEHLDPALIRPGRINKKIFLGRLFQKEAVCMVKHYFPEASQQKIEQFGAKFVQDAITPAELEALCGVCPTVDDLIEKVTARFQAI